MKILLLLTVVLSQFVWAEDNASVSLKPRENWIEGKVTMIDDRVNAGSAHYAVIRLTNVKVMSGESPDRGVVFSVLKDIDNSANFPAVLRKQYYQGQHCLDMAKQAFASGKKFFIAPGDNGSEITSGGTWYADGMESFIVTDATGKMVMAPGRCGIMN